MPHKDIATTQYRNIMLLSVIWDVNPELISLGPLSIRWYGFLYALGFFIAITIIGKMFKRDGAPEGWLDKVFIYMVLAVIVGARLGHVFFYSWDYYKDHIPEIFMVWEGGLASHGGAIAMFITAWLLSHYMTKQNIFWLGDRVFTASTLVAGMIRIGNLMNSEIYGGPTGKSWGFIFKRGQEQFVQNPDGSGILEIMHYRPGSVDTSMLLPTHPTQLYEAGAYFILFIFMMWLYWKRDAGQYNGLLTGIGLIGIFVSRFIIEFWKNNQSDFAANMTLNMGQWLSVPFIIAGIILIIRALQIGPVVYYLPKQAPKKDKKKK